MILALWLAKFGRFLGRFRRRRRSPILSIERTEFGPAQVPDQSRRRHSSVDKPRRFTSRYDFVGHSLAPALDPTKHSEQGSEAAGIIRPSTMAPSYRLASIYLGCAKIYAKGCHR